MLTLSPLDTCSRFVTVWWNISIFSSSSGTNFLTLIKLCFVGVFAPYSIFSSDSLKHFIMLSFIFICTVPFSYNSTFVSKKLCTFPLVITIFPNHSSIYAITPDTTFGSLCEICVSLIYQHLVYCLPSIVLLLTRASYFLS